MKRNKSFPSTASLEWTLALFLAAAFMARADIVVPGADGSDGAFNPTNANTTIDLNAAVIGSWTNLNTSPGNGVYDQEKWAVVFRYSSVNIPSNVTVRFMNRPDGNPPVVWLVSGNVTINGSIILDGEGQQGDARQSNPGPGGFRGGIASRAPSGSTGSSGFGIGGGDRNSYNGNGGYATGGSFGTRPNGRSGQSYGGTTLIPLIGGSGGGGSYGAYVISGGGSGGGAMLLAASTRIVLNGQLIARGGNSAANSDQRDTGGAGAGGGWRLISEEISGRGVLDVRGGDALVNGFYLSPIQQAYGGGGRIRLEARKLVTGLVASPVASFATATSPVQLWPADTTPRVQIASVGAAPAPQYPNGGVPGELAVGSTTGISTVTVEAFNLATNATVRLRVTPYSGGASEFLCTRSSGDDAHSFWQAQVPMSPGNASLQVRATTQ